MTKLIFKLVHYAKLMRLHKPIGTFLLLWPTLMALWMASEGKPDLKLVVIFIAGVIVMRAAGCVINDLADREFDKAVTRTALRPLPQGVVTPKEALGLFWVLLSIAFLLVTRLNAFTRALSIMGALLALIYPFTKRWTYLPQLVLGAAFGWAVPMVYAAVQEAIPLSALLLYIATFCWTVAYDTQYAMADRQEDIIIGVKSFAIWLGARDKIVILGLHLTTLGILILLGYMLELGVYYYSGLAGAGVLALYQQHLIRDRTSEGCFKAFLNNNYFGAVLFWGLSMDYLCH